MSRGATSWTRPETFMIDPSPKGIDPKGFDKLLFDLLSLCTPHGHEHHIRNIITNCKFVQKHPYELVEGNAIITVKDPQDRPLETMFSSHMDIVGSVSKENADAGKVDRIVLCEDRAGDFIYGAKVTFEDDEKTIKKLTNSTLGADDKVGVFILLRMIQRNIPGIYCFHVGEECGGIGSRALATNHKEKFTGIKRAVAFDRAGFSDVIAFQRGGRCCSKEFGDALARELNISMPPKEKFKSEITGSFTDTANYKDIIPECTNISVGYFNQHGITEKLDYYWLRYILLPAILNVEWNKLPTIRDPSKKETYSYSGNTWKQDKEYYDGNKYNASRKSWAETDENTYVADLPLWFPRMGYPEGANLDALQKAVRVYLTTTTLAYERDNMAEAYVKAVEHNRVMTEELKAKDAIIARLTGTEIPEETIKEEEDPFDADAKIVEKELLAIEDHSKNRPTNAVQPTDVTPKEEPKELDEDSKKKVDFLSDLVQVAQLVPTYMGVDEKLFKAYTIGAATFLATHATSKSFTSKENRKLNSMMYKLSTMITLIKYQMDEPTEVLIDEIWNYICANYDQEGFGDHRGVFSVIH